MVARSLPPTGNTGIALPQRYVWQRADAAFRPWTLLLCCLLPIGSLTAYVEGETEEEAEMGMFSLDPTQGAAWRYGSFVAKVHGRWQVGMVAFWKTS